MYRGQERVQRIRRTQHHIFYTCAFAVLLTIFKRVELVHVQKTLCSVLLIDEYCTKWKMDSTA